MRILVLEDDPVVAERIVAALQRDLDASTEVVARGEDALARASRPGFDALVLDRLVVGLDGLSVLTELRRMSVNTPALILSSKSSPHDKTEGLEDGADDYLGKPFEDFELVARVRAMLRRAARLEHPDVRGHGPLVLSVVNRRALWEPGVPADADRFRKRVDSDSGRDLQLTGKEFDVVLHLVEAYPDPRSKDDVWRFAWQNAVQLADWQQVVHVNLSRLRSKLEERTGRRQVVALAQALQELPDGSHFASLEEVFEAVVEGDIVASQANPAAKAPRGAPRRFDVRRSGSVAVVEVHDSPAQDKERKRGADCGVPPILSTVANKGYAITAPRELEKLAVVADLFRRSS